MRIELTPELERRIRTAAGTRGDNVMAIIASGEVKEKAPKPKKSKE